MSIHLVKFIFCCALIFIYFVIGIERYAPKEEEHIPEDQEILLLPEGQSGQGQILPKSTEARRNCFQNEYGPNCVYCLRHDTCQDGHYTCDKLTGSKICLPGYKGELCQTPTEPEVNHYHVPCPENECRNGGSCASGHCCCLEGFTGVLCEIEIIECNNESCINEGICKDLIGGFKCICKPGYKGNHCEIKDSAHGFTTPSRDSSCQSTVCMNNGICFETVFETYCICPDFYTGAHCETNLIRKENIVGSCPENFYGSDCAEFCLQQDNCMGHFVCDPYTGKRICKSGWHGDRCDTRILPQNIDPECPVHGGCKNDGQCFSQSCCCKHHFSGDYCNVESIGCVSSPCRNNATCFDQGRDFTCVCGEQYTGALCEYTLKPQHASELTKQTIHPSFALSNTNILVRQTDIKSQFYLQTVSIFPTTSKHTTSLDTSDATADTPTVIQNTDINSLSMTTPFTKTPISTSKFAHKSESQHIRSSFALLSESHTLERINLKTTQLIDLPSFLMTSPTVPTSFALFSFTADAKPTSVNAAVTESQINFSESHFTSSDSHYAVKNRTSVSHKNLEATSSTFYNYKTVSISYPTLSISSTQIPPSLQSEDISTSSVAFLSPSSHFTNTIPSKQQFLITPSLSPLHQYNTLTSYMSFSHSSLYTDTLFENSAKLSLSSVTSAALLKSTTQYFTKTTSPTYQANQGKLSYHTQQISKEVSDLISDYRDSMPTVSSPVTYSSKLWDSFSPQVDMSTTTRPLSTSKLIISSLSVQVIPSQANTNSSFVTSVTKPHTIISFKTSLDINTESSVTKADNSDRNFALSSKRISTTNVIPSFVAIDSMSLLPTDYQSQNLAATSSKNVVVTKFSKPDTVSSKTLDFQSTRSYSLPETVIATVSDTPLLPNNLFVKSSEWSASTSLSAFGQSFMSSVTVGSRTAFTASNEFTGVSSLPSKTLTSNFDTQFSKLPAASSVISQDNTGLHTMVSAKEISTLETTTVLLPSYTNGFTTGKQTSILTRTMSTTGASRSGITSNTNSKLQSGTTPRYHQTLEPFSKRLAPVSITPTVSVLIDEKLRPLAASESGLSDGWTIALSIIGCVAAVALAAVVILVIYRHKRRKDSREITHSPSEIVGFSKEHFSTQPDFNNPIFEEVGEAEVDSDDDSVKYDIYVVNT